MKFEEKYELLESLTDGAVETFVANDRARGERVLVHIVHCEAQKPNQPTVQWVLEGFRRVAPEPAGVVLETGRYSGTLYAYLVTRLPDEAVLGAWVKRYEEWGTDAPEILTTPAKPDDSIASENSSEGKFNEAAPVRGQFTQLFQDPQWRAKPNSPITPSHEAEQSSQPPLKPVGDPSGLHAAPAENALTPPVSVNPKEEPIGSGPLPFRSDFAARNLRPETITQVSKDHPKPGEFTSFFQSPFRAEGPPNVPAAYPKEEIAIEPPRKTVGEFTAQFGQIKPPPEEPPPAPVTPNDASNSGFSKGWLIDPEIPGLRSSATATPPLVDLPRTVSDAPSTFPLPSREPFVPPQPASPKSSTAPVFPALRAASSAIEKPPIAPAFVSPDDTFSPPDGDQVPAPAPVATPPSAYTQIISVKAPTQAEPASGVQKEASPKLAALPALPKLAMPAITPPPPPKMPPIPVPPLPTLKPPKVESVQPPVSYWPLVLTLTVLFFIAVLLVLYFVLKH